MRLSRFPHETAVHCHDPVARVLGRVLKSRAGSGLDAALYGRYSYETALA